MQLNAREKARRQHVEDLKLSARTLAEIAEAKAAIRAWRMDYPEDQTIRELGEVLSHSEDFANERETEAIALGLDELQRRERERILVECDRVNSAQAAQQARAKLHAWLARNPADQKNVSYDLDYLNRTEDLYSKVEGRIAKHEAESVPSLAAVS